MVCSTMSVVMHDTLVYTIRCIYVAIFCMLPQKKEQLGVLVLLFVDLPVDEQQGCCCSEF